MSRLPFSALAFVAPYALTLSCGDPAYDLPADYALLAARGPDKAIGTGETTVVNVVSTEVARDHDYGMCGHAPVRAQASVVAATCAPDCSAHVINGGARVTATAAGPKRVTLALHAQDDSSGSVATTVEFRDVTTVLAKRGSGSPSGTAFAMSVGDEQTWSLTAGDDTGSLLANVCRISTSASGPVDLDLSTCANEPGSEVVASNAWRSLKLKARAPGTADIDLTYGAITTRATLTVVDPARARSVEIRRVQQGEWPIADANVLFEREVPVPLVYRCDNVSHTTLVTAFEMADGTRALGGTGAIHAEPARALTLEPYGQTVLASVSSVIDGDLVGSFGAMQLSTPYAVQSGCVGTPVRDAGLDAAPRGDADPGADAAADAAEDAAAEDASDD